MMFGPEYFTLFWSEQQDTHRSLDTPPNRRLGLREAVSSLSSSLYGRIVKHTKKHKTNRYWYWSKRKKNSQRTERQDIKSVHQCGSYPTEAWQIGFLEMH
jgi:hypothetical protein